MDHERSWEITKYMEDSAKEYIDSENSTNEYIDSRNYINFN